MNTRPFTLGVVQMRMDPDPAANLDKAEAMARRAARDGAGLVCLPELFHTRYFCRTEDHDAFALAESADGESVVRLAEAARDTGTVLMVPIFEKRAPGVYHNTLVFLGPDGRTLGMYRKAHIPDDPGYHEKFYFTPGDTGFPAVDTPRGPVAGLVCWDQWFPEAARLCALAGALVLAYPTAIGWHPHEKDEYGREQVDAWTTIQRGHAVANGMYVAAANRVGLESTGNGDPGIEFWGSSFICGPMGEILAKASDSEEEILLAEIDPARVEDVRRHWPFFRDRRIDEYQGLLKRWLDG